MNVVEKYGGYRILYFPRKRIYRASKVSEYFSCYACFQHKTDFNTIEEIKNAIGLAIPSEIISNDPYNTAIRWLRNNNEDHECYKLIECLVGQYQYGIEPKKELKALLTRMGILKNS